MGGVNKLRLVGFVVLLWWTVRLATGLADRCFMDLVNLAFHEAGHVFLTPFGTTMHFLGGTFGQLAVPAILIAYFLVRQHQPPGAAFSAWWLGESFVNVAIYMADARDLAIPLVGGGVHDWNHLFFQFGVLDADSVAMISGTTKALGVVIMLIGLAWWLVLTLPPGFQERFKRGLPDDRLRALFE